MVDEACPTTYAPSCHVFSPPTPFPATFSHCPPHFHTVDRYKMVVPLSFHHATHSSYLSVLPSQVSPCRLPFGQARFCSRRRKRRRKPPTSLRRRSGIAMTLRRSHRRILSSSLSGMTGIPKCTRWFAITNTTT